MRIAVLANAGSVHTRRWASALAGRGHEVAVFGIRDGDIPGADVRATGSGAPRSRVGALWAYLRLLWTARRRLREFDPHVVHAHYATTHGVIAALRSPVPFVLTVWGSDVMRGDRPVRRPLRWLARLAVGRAATVTSAGEAMADIVASIGNARPDIVRFGVDTTRFASVGRPPDVPFTVGFLKGLHERYGPDVLLDAWARVVAAEPQARLVLAGDGPMRRPLELQAKRLGITGRVEFIGPIDPAAVPGFMERIHVLANPSRTESFGVVLLEAAAAGVPTVATAVGGTAEAMRDEVTGVLVPPGLAEPLGDALLRLAGDRDLRDRLGDHGRTFAAGFEWAGCVDRMERVLEEAAT